MLGNVFEKVTLNESFILIRMLAKDELLASVQKCAEELESVKSKEMKKALVQLRELLAKFQQIDGES